MKQYAHILMSQNQKDGCVPALMIAFALFEHGVGGGLSTRLARVGHIQPRLAAARAEDRHEAVVEARALVENQLLGVEVGIIAEPARAGRTVIQVRENENRSANARETSRNRDDNFVNATHVQKRIDRT